jgi:hypothetical protein
MEPVPFLRWRGDPPGRRRSPHVAHRASRLTQWAPPAGNRHRGRKRPALKGKPPGPIADFGEQEAGHDRGEIAEQHLVHMPGNGRKGAERGETAVEQRQPEHHRTARIEGAGWKNGRKPWERIAGSFPGLGEPPSNLVAQAGGLRRRQILNSRALSFRRGLPRTAPRRLSSPCRPA